MPTSSSRKAPPLRPTYKIERELIAEHNHRMKLASSTFAGQPICPDCYKPCNATGEKPCNR